MPNNDFYIGIGIVFAIIALIVYGVRRSDAQRKEMVSLTESKKLVTKTECPNCGNLGEFGQQGMGFLSFLIASVILLVIGIACLAIPVFGWFVVIVIIIGWFYMLMNVRSKSACSKCKFEGTPTRVQGYYEKDGHTFKFVKQSKSE